MIHANLRTGAEEGRLRDDVRVTLKACGRDESGIQRFVYPMSRAQTLTGQDLPLILTMAQEPRYLAAKRTTPKGEVYASVFVAKDTNPGVPRSYNRSIVLLQVAETAAMDTGLVAFDAAAMAKEIASSGRVALYGIYFDTNKAELKPESYAAIQEIAKLLKNDPAPGFSSSVTPTTSAEMTLI